MAMLISLVSFAQDAPIYELVPASGSNNSYAGNCDITINGIKWNLTGNSTMQPWRLGGKSITNQDRALYSKTPLAYNIDKIEVTHGTASGITVNSFKLIISDEANGAGETIDVAFKASATTTIDLPEGDYTDKYFKFLYNVTNSTSNNKFVQFTGAKFYAALAEDAVKAPVITGAEDFISETEVTIEAEDDVTVYYTLDGTEPTTASTVYAAPFTVKETTTVKAVAYRGETASFVTSATFTQATRVTAAEAAQLAMKVASNNALTSVTYVIDAYVTSVIDQTLSSGQQRFWVADTKDGGQVLQSYYCNVPQVLKVGDYIQMFGKLTKYNTSPQMKNGQVTIIPECSLATNVKWTETIALEANADKWYLVDIAEAVAAEKDLTLSITNTSEEDVEVTIDSYSTCPADELDRILASTKTIKAGQTLEKDVNFVKYLQGLVDQVYLHVTTVGGAIEVKAETAKFNVTATAENGTVEGAGIYEQGAEATLTATPAKGYEFVNWTSGETVVSTENPYKFTVTADVALVANFKQAAPATETVYFINNKSWSKVNTYAWDPTQNAGWPGKAATKEAEQVAGYDVYSYTAKVGAHKNVIFNNGSSQTNDLKWTAGKYYWMGNAKNFAGATKEEAEAALAKPVEYESVYFVNAQGWAKVNIYTWTPEVGTWPGVAMTKEAEQLAGYDVYSYKVEKGTSFGGMLFNNTIGTQTGDLQWTAGKYYVKDGWYTKEEAEAKLAAPVVVTWTMVGQEELFTPAWTPTAVENDMEKQEDGSYVLVLENKTLKAGQYEYKAVKDHDWAVSIPQDGNDTLEIAKDGDYTIEFTVNAAATELTTKVTYIEPEIEWIPMDLEIANLTTEVMEVEGAKYLQLMGRDDMNDADVILFLNNYADVDDDYEVNTESSYMTFGGMELTVLEGVMTQTSETDKGTIYTGTVRASAEEEGETMYVEFALTMYAAPATVIELTDAIVAINEELGTLTFNVPTGEGEGYYAELAGYTAPGVHEGPQICLFMTPEVVAYTNYAETSVADDIITLKGEFVSPMGAKFDVTISGKLPVEEPVVKPEPTYTENNLNTYAFGLESVLTDEALVVTYRLNNSNADEVQVVVLNGSEVVATVSGTKTIGKNTVEVPTATLPQGVQLTSWLPRFWYWCWSPCIQPIIHNRLYRLHRWQRLYSYLD